MWIIKNSFIRDKLGRVGGIGRVGGLGIVGGLGRLSGLAISRWTRERVVQG